MHTEHLQNVHPAWVATGWLTAAATTSLVFLVLVSLELLGGSATRDAVWVVIAVALGFWTGGFVIGFRAVDAPILHGIAIGLTSLIAWFLLNLLVAIPFGTAEWRALTPTTTAALLVVQMIAAMGGAWLGHNIALGNSGSAA